MKDSKKIQQLLAELKTLPQEEVQQRIKAMSDEDAAILWEAVENDSDRIILESQASRKAADNFLGKGKK